MDNLILDFEQARSKHLLFKSRLRSILYDISVDEGPVLSQFECSVGQWIYSHALKAYGHIPEMHDLEKVHGDIHTSAKELVTLHKSGQIQEAKNGLSEMERIADNLVELLFIIEKKIKAEPLKKTIGSQLEIRLDEYYDLLRSNAELDKRIKHQILEGQQSLLRFETVLSALHEGIIIQDEQGVLQVVNNSAKDLLGIPFDHSQASNFKNKAWIVYSEDGNVIPRDEYPPMLVLKNRIPQIDRILGIRRPDNSLVWIQINAQPLIDKTSGTLTGVVSSFFDVTSVRKTTADLQESEKRFRLLAETTPQMIFTANVLGQADYFNPQWLKYSGFKVGDLLNWGWSSLIHPDDLQKTLETFLFIRGSQTGGEFENRYRRADGEHRWHMNQIRPIKNDQKEVILWIGSAIDIHDLKHLQEQKDDFISIASHELKTPITSLKASLQLLDKMKDNPSPEMLSKLIGMANKNIDKVNTLIADLLDVSRFNQGQLHIKKCFFSIASVVEESCAHIYLAAEYRILILGNEKLQVYADPERIEQVIVNLVNNAIKYAPESKEIKIEIMLEENMVKVSVSDNGPGIKPEKIPHLFDRYFRVDSSGIQYSGLGLGLYICGEIIKKLGGEIGVVSEPGLGSTFWFTLPIDESNLVF